MPGAGADGIVGMTAVRTLLIGDVLLRAVETEGRQVLHDCLPRPQSSDALGRVLSDFSIHPPSGFTGPADAHVVAGAHRDGERGVWIEVGPVRPDTTWAGPGPGPGPGPGADADADPPAVRLALLGKPYAQPLTFTAREVEDAGRTLGRWRASVARWARSPSRPVPEEILQGAARAIGDNLDTPALLGVLHEVEGSSGVPDGARFETFAHVDRVLGLDLTREVGR
ncbi:hypothetical protein [Streptomyces sp. NPDC051909]|uniref:hypothetical protein n=1 Tax=Streptomyces sp. NPDC051909 TaxID=3154944 RepID=UPI00341FD555